MNLPVWTIVHILRNIKYFTCSGLVDYVKVYSKRERGSKVRGMETDLTMWRVLKVIETCHSVGPEVDCD